MVDQIEDATREQIDRGVQISDIPRATHQRRLGEAILRNVAGGGR